MTGNTHTALSSVLPMDARTARFAGGGGLVVSLQDPPRRIEVHDGGYVATGYEPDGLDLVAPQAAESRNASSSSVPCPSVQAEPVMIDNPT